MSAALKKEPIEPQAVVADEDDDEDEDVEDEDVEDEDVEDCLLYTSDAADD